MVSDSVHVNGVSNGGEKIDGKHKAHVLFVTVPFPGHFAPKVQLIYHLEAKYPGTTVTVWGNKDRIADLEKLQRKGDLKDLDLHLVQVFGEPPPYPDPVFPIRAATTVDKNIEECEHLRAKLIAQKNSPGGPTAIVADQFQWWSKDFADELGIPWFTYFSCSPMFLLNVVEIPRLVKAGIHPWHSPNLNDRLEPDYPGFPHIRIRDLVEETFNFDKFYANILERSKGASGILLNASEEMDCPAGTVDATRKLLPSTRILTIGPSLQFPGFGKIYSAVTSSSSNCVRWLDSQPAKSVLYIAFGSLGAISKNSTMALAAGLEAAGVRFLWALRVKDTTDPSQWLPEGFVERNKGRGFVETAWAPQATILAHPATGGFLSHGGWNSTLESFCAGVPLICWPLSAEQYMNARFVSDIAKVGIAICYAKEEEQDSFENITSQTVATAVKQLMVEEKGDELRRNAEAVQKSLFAAVAEGGSSYRNLNTLIDELAGVKS